MTSSDPSLVAAAFPDKSDAEAAVKELAAAGFGWGGPPRQSTSPGFWRALCSYTTFLVRALRWRLIRLARDLENGIEPCGWTPGGVPGTAARGCGARR
jgi:hypothetical protein